MTDYTALITSEHSDQPDFVQTVALTANGIADITALAQSLPLAFDLDAAVFPQLDVDGQWIGLARTVGGVFLINFFGFGDDASALGFGELTDPSAGGRFIELGEDASTTATLADPEYRLVLRAKILQNDWDGGLAEFEAALLDVVGTTTTVVDPGTTVVMIKPTAAIDPVLQQLLTGYDLIPRAAGVRYQFVFPVPAFTWTLAGTATAPVQTTVQKATGVAAWNSAAWVANPAAHVWLQWTVPDVTNGLMGGLSANPSGSPNYPSLNFGLFNTAGGIQVWEAGVQQNGPFAGGSWGSYQAGDSFAVYWDGKSAVYLHNDAPFKITTPGANPGALAPMFCLFSVGAQANNIYLSTG
jgi:hypothetical protein